jgi:hypothetical protein
MLMNSIEDRWREATIRFKCRTRLACIEMLVVAPTLEDLHAFFGANPTDDDIDEYLQPHVMETWVRMTFEPHMPYKGKVAENSATTADLWFQNETFAYDVDRALFEYVPAC